MRVVAEGLRHRRWPWEEERLLAWDDLAALAGAVATDRHGGSWRLGPAELEAARRVLAGPALDGGLAESGKALENHVLGHFAPGRTARALVDAAGRLAASDVHVEPEGASVAIRLRIEGELVRFAALPPEQARRITAALKGLAGCLPYRADVVQEGRIARAGVGADVRASFVPVALGERVALRLFGRLRTLEELGLPDDVRAAVGDVLRLPGGLFLVAGATGAGKTTTLYAALAHAAKVRPGAHLSLEDPVEQRLRLAGVPVDQVELDPARGVTGQAMLAAALRQDVDVVAVGEVRTADEARLAVQAAHTGRLVLAGVHAGSADEARQRLVDLGADGKLAAQVLRGVLHQALVIEKCACGTGCARCGGLGRMRRLEARLWRPAAGRLEVAA